MFKVLLIGAAYAAAENCKKLEELGKHCELTAVTVSKARSAQSGIELENKFRPIGVHQFIQLNSIGNPSSSTRYLLSGLSDVFRNEKFDVICVESEPWGFICWQAWLLKLRFQAQAVFGSFTWENLERPFLKQLSLNFVYRAFGRITDYVVCGSIGSETLIKKLSGNVKTYIAPQIGVDQKLFNRVASERKLELRKNFGLPLDTFIIGFCGRLTHAKGVDILLDALLQLFESKPRVSVSSVFLGRGDFRATIENKLGDRVFFPEPLPHDRVCEFMQAIDVLVLPSRTVQTWRNTWQEQFGHVLIEAMACETPVVGSSSGAIPEVIGDAGLVFRERNAVDLKEKLLQLIEDQGLYARLSKLGRERVLQFYSNQTVGKKWAEIFKDNLKLQ